MRSQDGQPRTINIIQVDDVDAFADSVAARGGEVVVPKMAIQGVGYSAYFKDPSGLLVGLYQPDPTAQSTEKAPAEASTG